RALILTNDKAARLELLSVLSQELAQQSFGQATTKVVGIFQKERHLPSNGEVDERTAGALNKLLHELESLDAERKPDYLLVTGVVRREDGIPLRGARIRAALVSKKTEIRLGDDSADIEGRYTIRYDALP